MRDAFDDDGSLHCENIANDWVYGNIGDVMICSLLFDCNILLFQLNKKKKEYTVIPIQNVNSKMTICLKYDGVEHFEAMLPMYYYDESLIEKTQKDSQGKFNVLQYVTNKKSEDRMFYLIEYEDGSTGRKTEYQLINECVTQKRPVFSNLDILMYRAMKNELKFDFTIDESRKKELVNGIRRHESLGIHLIDLLV